MYVLLRGNRKTAEVSSGALVVNYADRHALQACNACTEVYSCESVGKLIRFYNLGAMY